MLYYYKTLTEHVSTKVQNAITRPTPPYFVHLYHNRMSLIYIIIIIIIIIIINAVKINIAVNQILFFFFACINFFRRVRESDY